MKLRSLCVTASLALASLAIATPVHATAPSNDEPAGATVIAFDTPIVQDISEATVSPGEPICTDSLTNVVWFTFTATTRAYVTASADTDGSWSSNVAISAGVPDMYTCNQASLITTPGTVYYVAVANTAWWAMAPMIATVTVHSEPLANVSVTVASARALADGTGLFTFTVKCDTPVSVDANIWVSQVVGKRFRVPGYGWGYTECVPGEKTSFTIQVTPDAGKFGGGRVEMPWYWTAYGAPVDNPGGFSYTTVTMRG